MKFVSKLRRSIIGESIFSLTVTRGCHSRERLHFSASPTFLYSIEKRVRKMLLVSRAKAALHRRSFSMEIRIVSKRKNLWENRRNDLNSIYPVFNIKINSPFKEIRERKFEFRDKIFKRWQRNQVTSMIRRNVLSANREREYARRGRRKSSRNEFRRLKKRGKMREFHERVVKTRPRCKGEGRMGKGITVSWTTFGSWIDGAGGEDEDWIQVIRLRFSIGQLPLIRGYIAA